MIIHFASYYAGFVQRAKRDPQQLLEFGNRTTWASCSGTAESSAANKREIDDECDHEPYTFAMHIERTIRRFELERVS